MHRKYERYPDLPQIEVLRQLDGWPLISFDDVTTVSWEDIGALAAQYGVPLLFDIQVAPDLFNATEITLWVFLKKKIAKFHCLSLNLIFQINKDTLTNPTRIIGNLDESFKDNLDEAFLRKTPSKPSPYENFLRRMAYRLRDLEGSWKMDWEIDEEIEELMDFRTKWINVSKHRF